jgi:type III restriction enzyme
VVLGLRPFTAKAEILPEQVIGRGLRLMTEVTPDRTQTLEVLGTRNLLQVLRDQLEAEGVGFGVTRSDPPMPVMITPVRERLPHDIAIPITKPSLVHDVRKLSDLQPKMLDAIYDQEDLKEQFRVKLRMEFATTNTEVHQMDIAADDLPTAQELLASVVNKIIDRARLPNRFAEMYPVIREYVASRCFGRTMDLNERLVRSHLARLEIQEGIATYVARKIAELTLERRAIEFDKADFRLSETKPFSWRRNLPPLAVKNTVFNHVATYNDFERRFAQFLAGAKDVLRFASLGTTEQGDSGTQFRIDYLKPSGAIGFYHPDWAAVQKSGRGEINWIIETKGRVWEGTTAKDAAMQDWCERVSEATKRSWKYMRVNQPLFETRKPTVLSDLIEAIAAATLCV